ncbi:MAG: hypothetical protein R6U13_11585 [Desulfatiglandaceae bacterium]
MAIFDWLHRKQKEHEPQPERQRATPVDNAIARLNDDSDEDRVVVAMELLKSLDSEVKAAIASEIARLDIKAMGVWYELANALADDHEPLRMSSAETFWRLEGVGYAIRSLRDEYESSAHMSKESALRGIRILKEAA